MKPFPIVLAALLSAGCGGGSTGDDQSIPAAPSQVQVDEEAALAAIRDIRQAQSDFMATRRRYAQFMEELVDALLIPAEPSWSGSGYQIRIRSTPAADGYSATLSAPAAATDRRSFYVDDSGVIRWALGEAATADSPALEREGAPTGETSAPEQ